MADKPGEKPPVEPASTAPTIDTSVSATTAATKPTSGAESPRTARDPDFDDDEHEQTLPVPERQPTPKGGPKRVSFQEDEGPAPPPKPPRPMSPRAKAEATLIEAFPSIDIKVVKAVLIASNGKVEPAFNALLGMSDPDFVNEPAAPAAPPRPPRKDFPLSQEESDAMYARQLAEHYDSSYDGYGAPVRGDPPLPRRKRQDNLKPNELYDDKERSFIDDDLPMIKQNLQKGFEDTKNTINKWFKDLQKKMDGDEDDDIPARPQGPGPRRQDFGPSKSDQLLGIRKSAEGRRSGERERYDADPQVLSDDFGHRLELRDDEAPPPRPPRPLANPDLFKGGEPPAALGIKSAAAAADRKGSPSAGPAGAARPASGKWQPLASVEPKPADELEDHDPFSLGDSDEEAADAGKHAKPAAEAAAAAKKDAKPEAKKDEVAAEAVEKKGA